ncbi:unnamed protein product [Leptidea sinapis]|uniref:Uncharacterized protein n=1 Tax=Leptidea sinapis TaxID=189913 RepID=A0A5E4QHN0_9NEOP|nr:unnamed protein product [Leptidea sinapis]
MYFKIITLHLLVGALTITAIDLDVTGEWKTDLGWEVICTWETWRNDTLQSVRLYNNGQQFMIYRPENTREDYERRLRYYYR